VRLIDAAELRRRLPMRAAIDALEAAFAAGVPPVPLRMHATTPDGELLLMPAAGPQGVGVKLISLTPANPERGLPFVQGTYTLFDAGSQEPVASIDGAALTALRTGAVSGLATRWLARPDSGRLVVFGAGVQARSHVEAMRAPAHPRAPTRWPRRSGYASARRRMCAPPTSCAPARRAQLRW
jgi:ornithine cyclodeaminase/alanine dehydrogenase-like protein (mu-crystallin family)